MYDALTPAFQNVRTNAPIDKHVFKAMLDQVQPKQEFIDEWEHLQEWIEDMLVRISENESKVEKAAGAEEHLANEMVRSAELKNENEELKKQLTEAVERFNKLKNDLEQLKAAAKSSPGLTQSKWATKEDKPRAYNESSTSAGASKDGSAPEHVGASASSTEGSVSLPPLPYRVFIRSTCVFVLTLREWGTVCRSPSPLFLCPFYISISFIPLSSVYIYANFYVFVAGDNAEPTKSS